MSLFVFAWCYVSVDRDSVGEVLSHVMYSQLH